MLVIDAHIGPHQVKQVQTYLVVYRQIRLHCSNNWWKKLKLDKGMGMGMYWVLRRWDRQTSYSLKCTNLVLRYFRHPMISLPMNLQHTIPILRTKRVLHTNGNSLRRRHPETRRNGKDENVEDGEVDTTVVQETAIQKEVVNPGEMTSEMPHHVVEEVAQEVPRDILVEEAVVPDLADHIVHLGDHR